MLRFGKHQWGLVANTRPVATVLAPSNAHGSMDGHVGRHDTTGLAAFAATRTPRSTKEAAIGRLSVRRGGRALFTLC